MERNVLTGVFFLLCPLQRFTGPYVFLIFSAMILGFSCFIYFKVPETKGKSFEEIAEEFRRRKKGAGGAADGATELEHLGGNPQA